MRRQTLEILRGTLRQQLREPLTLFAMIGLPVLLQPVALWGAATLRTREIKSTRREELVVEAPPAFAEALRPRDHLQVVEAGWEDPAHPEVVAAITLDEGGGEVRYDRTRRASLQARLRAVRVLGRMGRQAQAVQVEALGLPAGAEDVLPLESEDVASEEERQGGLLGRVLPLILVFLAMNGGLSTALELVTGERERRTLETLLSARVDRRAVLLGKFLVVVMVSLVTSAVAVTTLWACLRLGLYSVPGESLAIPTAALPLLLGLLVPLAVLMAAGFTVVAAWVPDYRSGQLAALVLLFLALAAAGIAAFPAVQAGYALALLPVTNLALAMREALVGHFPLGILAVTFVATGVHVALALALGVRLLSSESVLFGAAGAADRCARGRFGPDVLAIFGIALLLLWFLGQRVQAMDLAWGMVFTQVVLVSGVAVGALVWLGQPVAAGLSLRRPRAVDLGLAVLAGLCAPGLSALIAAVQAPLLPVSQGYREALEAAMTLDAPLPVVVLVFALLPALCEETLFRGTLLGLLRRSWGPVAASIAVGALFGVVHMQLVRVLPTGLLGVLLCAAVLRGRSLWLSVTIHGLHNALLVLVSDQPWAQDPPLAVLVAMALVAVAAVAAMGATRSRSPGSRTPSPR